ncbi:hypothetical protein CRI94_12995 [Longibacter salinarum]|uniref:Uncharacterized protein n=1 Tax=Longibacter salinarum TaxID=1850348 RepID=A0A2A8CWE3_9BACT|nr:hypothetical protein [Longibacter salinarum]PEN12914.1 hypothetical protein CRI94_12995 [Longibacter salinarum]
MENEQLNTHLIELGNRATNAHEILRGVTDALAVIAQSAIRAASDDLDDVEDLEEWQTEAQVAAGQSEDLMTSAAALLRRTARRLESETESVERDD